MLKFISFGSGSSGNCYYLGTATDGLIIDIGIGIRTLKKYCREYGIQLNSVKRILITHDHADHIKSVGALSHDMNLPVYATCKVHEGIDHNYCVTRKVSADHKKELVVGESVQLGDFCVRTMFEYVEVQYQSAACWQLCNHRGELFGWYPLQFRLIIRNVWDSTCKTDMFILPHKVDCLVGYDPPNPCCQRTFTPIVEMLHGGQDLYEAVLNHIFHIIAVRDIPQSYRHGISLIAFIEPSHGLTVSCFHGILQLQFSFH